MRADVSIFSGDDVVLEVEVVDADGIVVDISGAQAIRWHMARTVHHRPAPVTKELGSGIAVTNGEQGRFDVTLDAADTQGRSGRYYHEAEIVDEQGHISTILTGAVSIRATNIDPVT